MGDDYIPPLVHLPGTRLTPEVVLHRTINKMQRIKGVAIVIQWDDDEPSDPAGAVRAAIHRAKVKLGPGVIGADYGLGYRCIPPVEIVRSDRSRCPCCGQAWPEEGR